jgi:hypothetical protein
VKATYYQLIVGNLYKLGANGILRCCVLEHERPMILKKHMTGLQEDIMQGRNCTKYFVHRDSGGLHFTKMKGILFSHAMYVKEWEIHPGGMKFL